MIARTWSGTAHEKRSDDYLRHLERAVLPEIRKIAGHRGAYVLRRGCEFQVITLWDSMDAIRQFAGDDPERAVIPPEASALLSRADERAVHWNVVGSP